MNKIFDLREILNLIWELNSLNTKKPIEIERLRTKGPYVDFLMSTGKENPIIKEYIEAIIGAGDVSPYSIGLMRIKAKDLNINNKNTRLVFAIHYLSIGKNLIK